MTEQSSSLDIADYSTVERGFWISFSWEVVELVDALERQGLPMPLAKRRAAFISLSSKREWYLW